MISAAFAGSVIVMAANSCDHLVVAATAAVRILPEAGVANDVGVDPAGVHVHGS